MDDEDCHEIKLKHVLMSNISRQIVVVFSLAKWVPKACRCGYCIQCRIDL